VTLNAEDCRHEEDVPKELLLADEPQGMAGKRIDENRNIKKALMVGDQKKSPREVRSSISFDLYSAVHKELRQRENHARDMVYLSSHVAAGGSDVDQHHETKSQVVKGEVTDHSKYQHEYFHV